MYKANSKRVAVQVFSLIFFGVICTYAQLPRDSDPVLLTTALPDGSSNTKKTTTNFEADGERTDNSEQELRRFEIGIHFSLLSLGTFDPTRTREWRRIAPFPSDLPFRAPKQNPKDPAPGLRFTYNFNKNIGVEAEANWYFQKEFIFEQPLIDRSPWQGGQKFQMLFGPKLGHRWKKFGVFGKARPGFIHFVSYPVVTFLQQVPPGQPFFSAQAGRRATFFNVDVGGVFEYYPSKRTIIRFDVGDTIIRYNAQEPKDINPSFTRHNLQLSLGFGFRF